MTYQIPKGRTTSLGIQNLYETLCNLEILVKNQQEIIDDLNKRVKNLIENQNDHNH